MKQINANNDNIEDSAIVVGASLSGLMTAIALSEQGINVTVFEKTKEGSRTGAGLKVDGIQFNQTKIEKKLRKIISDGKSGIELWTNLESRLRNEAHKHSSIKIHYDTRIASIGQNETVAWAKTESEALFKADILIGADGHRSIVRDEVAPHHPNAEYAGYVVWMASVPENNLPEDKRPKPSAQDVEMFNTGDGFMFGSVIEDDKDIRRVGTTWYDNTRTKLLERLGSVEGKVVHYSIDGSDLSDNDIDSLAKQAKINWPEPWRTATVLAIESRDFIGIPIKEYVPDALSLQRIALVGDAAHVPAPITASGFNESLKDAAVLSECASNGLKGDRAVKTLNEYEAQRLKKVQRMVESGRWFSQSFGRYI